jgi:hypothetical protein
MAGNRSGKRGKSGSAKGTVPRGGDSRAPSKRAKPKTTKEKLAETRRRSEAAKKAAATRARNAADKAADAGATKKGVRLTVAQQHLRDAAVIACLDAGWSQADTARELGCTTKTVQNAKKRMLESPSPLDTAPVQWVEQRMKGLLRSARTYRALALAVLEVHPPAAIGALKAADAVEARLDDMLIQMGKLPEDLSQLAAQAEMERVQQAMVECMEEVVAGERTPEEARDFFETLGSPESELAAISKGGDDGDRGD